MGAILGISGNYHDAAAALLIDGRVVGALQQERITRIKHDPSLPLQAAHRLLCDAGLSPGALDRVVFYENPYEKVERILVHGLRTASFRSLRVGLQRQLSGGLWVLDALATGLGVDRAKIHHVAHHQAHAAAAYYSSGWDGAAVLTVDGVGEWTSTAIWRGEGSDLRRVEALRFPHSLGLLYAAITGWTGFAVNGGEYKLMGLASYGTPRFRDEFAKLVQLSPTGEFSLSPEMFDQFTNLDRGFGAGLERVLGPPRPPREPWDLSRPQDQRWADVAATVQQITEEAMVTFAQRAQRLTGCKKLCLAGGVALNAVANAKVQQVCEDVWVQPAAGDAGGALGAAYLGALAHGDTLDRGFSPFLGVEADRDKTLAVAESLGLEVSAGGPAAIAAAIDRSEIIAVCQGRCEWGPRALGARSILASPHSASTRDALNRAVKHRESFRPFAPVVLESAYSNYFDGAPTRLNTHMTTVTSVHAKNLHATTHVDNTARVQTVHADEYLGAILDALHEPIALNTSLNGRAQPICGSGIDALSFFISHDITALFVEDIKIVKPPK